MPDRRGRKGTLDHLLPTGAEGRRWAAEVWADRHEVARGSAGAWLLRHAAAQLGIDQRDVDPLLAAADRERGKRE